MGILVSKRSLCLRLSSKKFFFRYTTVRYIDHQVKLCDKSNGIRIWLNLYPKLEITGATERFPNKVICLPSKRFLLKKLIFISNSRHIRKIRTLLVQVFPILKSGELLYLKPLNHNLTE